jgi:hypothetical protein
VKKCYKKILRKNQVINDQKETALSKFIADIQDVKRLLQQKQGI